MVFKRIFNINQIGLLIALSLLSLFLISFAPRHAKAVPLISNVAPIPGSGSLTGNNGVTTQPWFAVGTGGYDGAVSYAKIYVPNNTTSTLTVQHGCGVSAPDIGSPDVSYQVRLLDASESISAPAIATKNNSSCSNPITFTLNATVGQASGKQGHQAYHVFYFEAQITPALGDNEKNFRLSVNSGSFVGVSAPVVNYAKPWFGIYQRDAQSYGGTNWNWSVNYGPFCDEDNSNTTRVVNVYDIDWQVWNQPVLKADVQRDSRTDTGTNWSKAYYIDPGGNSIGQAPAPFQTDVTGTYGPERAWNESNFHAGSHMNDDLQYTSNNNFRYGIFFQDIAWQNTIQVRLPFDQFDGTTIVKCPVAYNATCTVDGKTSETLSSSATVTWKFNNTGASTWTPTDNPLTQYRRTVNGTSFSPITVPNNVAPGGSFSVQVSETQPAAGSGPKVIQYTMWRSGLGAFGSPCTLTIYPPGQTPNGVGNIQVSCSDVKIYGVNVPSTWHPTPNVHTGVATTIGVVPAQIIITDPSDGSSSTYTVGGGVPNDGSTKTISNTFGLWRAMWMHKSYTFQLVLQGVVKADSLTYNNNGDWANSAGTPYYASQVVNSDVVSGCMDAYCGSATPPDLEPGQNGHFQLGVTIVNNTSRGDYSSNSGSGYSFSVTPSDGLVNVSGVSASPDPIGTGSPTINVGFDGRLDYKGSFTVTLNFNGTPMALPSLTNPCPSGDIIPATRPFFEIRAGDISTGGGFTTNRNGSDSCADTAAGDSPYISPSKTGYNYSGDIRAFSRPNQVIGSLSQFGAYSLGLTIGTIGGPIGFYSGDNALFANASSPAFSSIDNQGYAGYLNASPPAHCTPVDFFNSTRTSPSTPAFNGDLTNSPSGQYTTSSTTINGATIGVGKQITLYVDGDLTINGDIKYAPDWDPSNQANIPYLVLIVRGNITLTNNVRQLDGLYIAQPNGTTGGYFDTCDSSTYCPSGLTVNGAIIAQQVDLLRASGSMGPCDSASSTCNLIGNGPAEVVNYSPAMVIGLPNLLQSGAGAVVPSGVEGIFSLPPVF